MGTDHLDDLHGKMPEVFQDRPLPPEWDESFVFVQLPNAESLAQSQVDSQVTDNELSIEYLEGAESGAEFSAPVGLNAQLEFLPGDIVAALGGNHAGAPVSAKGGGTVPPPDALAFYLPYHYFHPTWWGVYLVYEGVQYLAREIVVRSKGAVLHHVAVQASRLFLYYHEAYHHKTECFATRLELTHREALYKTGFERLFQTTRGTDDCMEEGLANAFALKKSNGRMKNAAVAKALAEYVLDSGKGYRRGVEFLKAFSKIEVEFAEENQRSSLRDLPKKDPSIWRSSSHLFDGISNVKGRVNYIIPRNSPLFQRSRFRPLLPPRKLIKKLNDLVGLTFERHGGNHDIYRAGNGNKIPIPRHPGDLHRGLIRKILRQASVDLSLEQFMSS